MSQQAICGTLFATATIKITHILESLHFFLESNYKLVPLVLWQNAANYDVVDMIIWLKKIKKQNNVMVPCSSKEDQILRIWYFGATTPNSDLILTITWPTKK